jgi:hypothetical protein
VRLCGPRLASPSSTRRCPHPWRPLAIVGRTLDPARGPGGTIALSAAVALAFILMGGLVLAGSPGHPVGRLMFAAGTRRAYRSWP